MLSAIAIVPAAPVLVPELMGAATDETAALRDAALAAAGELPERWVSVGTGRADAVFGPDQSGTFAGYGVDVPVALGPVTATPQELPLCVLIAAWLRGQVNPQATVDARVYATTHTADAAVEHGRRLRAAIDATAERVGVLVVADGAHTLAPAAPGGYRPDSAAEQHALDRALASGDSAALMTLPDAIVGRVAHQVLAGLAGSAPRNARELYRGAPYGVGYFVGVWAP
ncbi:hypothetical protein [Mycolicibacterium goodii]|uniref:hypothetical protein n=1 Tax=Mycolicibacterium goodii TaxID=134601 RepID=UPI001BDCBC6E|nr:hypothetical protein [Mycolicibacterium goodii]MBU8832314.1 hypothetical protein [Mycolicibacterium goodii]